MADNNQITSNPPAQTAKPQRVLPDGGSHFARSRTDMSKYCGGGDGNCLLWDGHIIDATFPLV